MWFARQRGDQLIHSKVLRTALLLSGTIVVSCAMRWSHSGAETVETKGAHALGPSKRSLYLNCSLSLEAHSQKLDLEHSRSTQDPPIWELPQGFALGPIQKLLPSYLWNLLIRPFPSSEHTLFGSPRPRYEFPIFMSRLRSYEITTVCSPASTRDALGPRVLEQMPPSPAGLRERGSPWDGSRQLVITVGFEQLSCCPRPFWFDELDRSEPDPMGVPLVPAQGGIGE